MCVCVCNTWPYTTPEGIYKLGTDTHAHLSTLSSSHGLESISTGPHQRVQGENRGEACTHPKPVSGGSLPQKTSLEPQVPAGAPPDCRPVCKPCTPSCTHPREALPGQPPSQITAPPPPPPHRSSPTHSVVPGASTPTRRTQSHLQRACPARLPSSPSHPHGQVRLHSRRGPRHVGEEGARAHPRAAPRPRRAGRRRRARPAGPQTPPPSAAKTAASVPFPA